MTDPKTPDAQTIWAAKQFEHIDNEIARLSSICRIDLLDRGNIERVIRNDDSACASKSPVAFDKMRNLLMMHYAARTKTAAVLGEAETQAIINTVVERIRERFASLGGGKP